MRLALVSHSIVKVDVHAHEIPAKLRQHKSLLRKAKSESDYLPLIQAHELGHKRLEMENDLAAHAYAVLVESAPFDDVGFEAVVDAWHELEGQGLLGISQVTKI